MKLKRKKPQKRKAKKEKINKAYNKNKILNNNGISNQSKLKDIMKTAMDLYREAGFENEWRLHHQGGPTGYDTRTDIATPANDSKLSLNQAVAWNPTIQGAKAEETALITRKGHEIISVTPGWPVVSVKHGTRTVKCYDILVK